MHAVVFTLNCHEGSKELAIGKYNLLSMSLKTKQDIDYQRKSWDCIFNSNLNYK